MSGSATAGGPDVANNPSGVASHIWRGRLTTRRLRRSGEPPPPEGDLEGGERLNADDFVRSMRCGDGPSATRQSKALQRARERVDEPDPCDAGARIAAHLRDSVVPCGRGRDDLRQ